MPQPQDNFRIVLIILLLLWVGTTPDNGAGLLANPSLASARLERQRAALDVLGNSTWGDFSPGAGNDSVEAETETGADPVPETKSRYLNMTGFREEDGLAWGDLGHFRSRCLQLSRYITGGQESQWDRGLAEPTWQNATGIVNGLWVRKNASVSRQASSYNLTAMIPSLVWMGSAGEWGRNVSGAEGKIMINLNDKDDEVEYEELHEAGEPVSGGLVRKATATVSIRDDEGSAGTYDMRLHGVHWPRQGALLLTTTSEKFAGIFALPHLAPGADFFQSSKKMLNKTLDEALTKQERRVFDPVNLFSSTPEAPGDNWNPTPHCEYVIYLQIHPLDSSDTGAIYPGEDARDSIAHLVKGIEDELRNPTGAPIHGVPGFKVSAVIYSPDCAYFLESKGPPEYPAVNGQHLVGFKEEVYIYGAKIWILAFAAVLFAQVQLLKGQMRESYTPSTMGRVSFYTATMMVLADGIVFAGASAWSLTASDTLLPSLMLTLAGFLSMTVGGSFLAEVYKVQESEWRGRQREQQQQPIQADAAAAVNTTANLPLSSDSLPRPVTANPPRDGGDQTPPIIIPSDQDIDAEIAENTASSATAVPLLPTTANPTPLVTARLRPAVVTPTPFSAVAGRLVLLGIFILFVSLASSSWWASVRAVYLNGLAFIYLSLWVPQIVRNVRRNSRRAFAWRFTIGQSILRLLPFAYFYLRRDNVLFAETDWPVFEGLALWVWVQLWALAFQDVLGPRFSIPRGWAPEAWDYHPTLREDNVESGGLPIGLVSSSAPASPTSPTATAGFHSGNGEEDTVYGPVAARASSGRREDRDRGRDKKGHTHVIDCAICREVLEVPVVRAGGEPDPATAGVAGLLARRQYMVTPCRHIFHSACLEGWLRFRLQCPICREELPPL